MPLASGADWKVEIVGAVLGPVTVDSELPAAALLADNTANPTGPGVAAFLMGWDTATWDRRQVETGGANLRVALFDGASKPNLATPSVDTVGAGTYNGLAVLGFNHLLNLAGTWDREKSSVGTHGNSGWNATVLSATTNSTEVDAQHFPLITVFGTLASISGTWDLFLQVSQDNVNWYNIAQKVLDVVTTNQDFEFERTLAGRFVRLRLVNVAAGSVTITATISAKRG